MANQTKNTTSTTNSTKNTGDWDTPYKKGGGLTWNEAEQTWENTKETWQDLEAISWSNQSKN